MFSTDHGGRNKEHTSFSRDNIAIPLLLKGPGIKQNYTIEGEPSILDIAPTVIRMLGLKPSPWWRGKLLEEALTQELLDAENKWINGIVSNQCEYTFKHVFKSPNKRLCCTEICWLCSLGICNNQGWELLRLRPLSFPSGKFLLPQKYMLTHRITFIFSRCRRS